MSKKKILTVATALSLAAVTVVGATMALFQDKTDTKVNTFTVGDVKIDLWEPSWMPDEGKTLVPGAEVEKDPFILNTGASDGYMMLQVSGMADMAAEGFSAYYKDEEGNYQAGYNTTDWVLVDNKGNRVDNPSNALVDGYYVYIGTLTSEFGQGAVKPNEATSPLFDRIKLAEDAKEINAGAYKVVAMYIDSADGKTLYTYKDLNGNVIEANENKVPKMVDGTEVPELKYVIVDANGNKVTDAQNKVVEKDTYAEAEAYVLDNFQEEASFVFNLGVTAYSIQAENVEYLEEGVYTWVAELTK